MLLFSFRMLFFQSASIRRLYLSLKRPRNKLFCARKVSFGALRHYDVSGLFLALHCFKIYVTLSIGCYLKKMELRIFITKIETLAIAFAAATCCRWVTLMLSGSVGGC